MDTIIDDSGDTTVVTTADGPADTSAQQPEPPAEPPAPEAEGAEAGASAEDASKDVISAEDARKLRIENRRVKETLREREEELAAARKAQMSEQERAIEEARAAVAAEYEAKMVASRLRERAAGKLANPADVTVFIEAGKFSSDVEDADLDEAIFQLLEERSYLAAQKPGAPQIDQGPIPQRPKGRSFNDLLNEHLGPRR